MVADNTAVANPMDSATETVGPRVDSRWWYWIAALPVLAVVVLAFLGVLAWAFLAGSQATFATALFAFIVFSVTILLFGVMCPIALYVDSQKVSAADVGWKPDPTLYGIVGVIGLFVSPVQVAVAAYYLWKRHEYVGTP